MIPSYAEWMAALEERHGKELQKKFSAAAVAVCGLGGLGSNIAVYLARAGIGRLILIDYDSVDITNLHRQQYRADQIGKYKADALKENLLQISPYTGITALNIRITEENCSELLKDADIVCEAFDVPEAKAMLTDIVLETMPAKYLIAASGMAGMGTPNDIRTRRIVKNFYLCGDGKSGVAADSCLLATRAALCAAHQAHTVLRIIAGEYDV